MKATPIFDDLPMCSEADDKASSLDRNWFERRPARSYRLRRVVVGEMIPTTLDVPQDYRHTMHNPNTLVLVKQVQPGLRIRLPLESQPIDCQCDECLGKLFDLILQSANVANVQDQDGDSTIN